MRRLPSWHSHSADGHVLAWPVTLPGEPAFVPALRVQSTPLGHDLFVWPTRETGLGNHLLDRALGKLIPADLVTLSPRPRVVVSPRATPYVAGSGLEERNAAADEMMVAHWADLCFHIWPPEGARSLSVRREDQEPRRHTPACGRGLWG